VSHPFETILSEFALKVTSDSRLETFIFDNNASLCPLVGKAESMELGCLNHYKTCNGLIARNSGSNQRAELVNDEASSSLETLSFELITFVYKPLSNVWVALALMREGSTNNLTYFPCANKADLKREILGNETLFFESTEFKKITLQSISQSALPTYFNLISQLIEPYSGHYSGMKLIPFDNLFLQSISSLPFESTLNLD
jgi:hypothetical protein